MKIILIPPLTVFLAWSLGFLLFSITLPTTNSPLPTFPADATVVLTGGSQRVEEGIKFQQQGLSKKLFISGVWKNTRPSDFFREYKITDKTLQNNIEFGHEADNTLENAQETLLWIKNHGFKSLHLVTSHYHMKRSLLEFYQRLEGVEIYPYVIIPTPFQQKAWWHQRELLLLIIREYNKYLWALGRCVGRWSALKFQALRRG